MRFSGLAHLVVLALALIGAAPSPQDQPSGEEVMRRVNARSRGGDSTMELRLRYRDSKQGDHVRIVAVQRKSLPAGYRTSFRITSPPHLEGISLLLLEDVQRQGMWMYFPAGDHLVAVVTRGLSALASDFSCEDLRVAFPAEQYEFRNLGPAMLEGQATYRIEMVPRGERLQRELGFARAVGWVLPDRWLLVRAEYFDSGARQPFKTFRAEHLELIDEVWTLRRYSMVNDRAKHSTEAEVVSVRYHLKLPAERFAPEALRPSKE